MALENKGESEKSFLRNICKFQMSGMRVVYDVYEDNQVISIFKVKYLMEISFALNVKFRAAV